MIVGGRWRRKQGKDLELGHLSQGERKCIYPKERAAVLSVKGVCLWE